MKMITGSLVVCASAGIFAAGALFYDPGTNSAARAAAPGTVSISGFAFQPASATRASTVTVANKDGVAHTVTADAGAFNVNVSAGASAVFKAPTKPGTYTFFCAIHPEMTGTLVVA